MQSRSGGTNPSRRIVVRKARLLGDDIPRSRGTEADAAAERAHLEWLARISPRYEEKLREIARAEAEERGKQVHLDFVARILNLREADWDPAKHPRGGYLENPGWFSPTSGFVNASDGEAEARAKPADSTSAQPVQGKSKEDILKALGGGAAAPEESPPLTGVLTWHSGEHEAKAKLLKVDGDNVVLQRDDNKNKVTVPIKKLSDDDQKLVDALKQKPPNIVLDSSSLPAADREAWERKVILAIGQLAGTKNGKEILGDINEVIAPPPQKLNNGQTIPSAPLNKNPITIVPRPDKDNRTRYTEKNRGSDDVRLLFDPIDTIGDLTKNGDRKRPPFVGLAKELHVAYNAIRGAYRPRLDAETKSREFENKLRVELGLPLAIDPKEH